MSLAGTELFALLVVTTMGLFVPNDVNWAFGRDVRVEDA
jgi:hypothetical protein